MSPSPGPALSPRTLVAWAADSLLDLDGRALAGKVEWWDLPSFETSPSLEWPVAVSGKGPIVLLLHGFDSSFLEFRRLAPLLASAFTLVIPDLYGFGFTPRPSLGAYGVGGVLAHLEALLDRLNSPVGLIGASMGGAVALELARRRPENVERLLLLDPAGLSGVARPLPPALAALGVRFLSLPWVRRGLCRSAYANPAASVGPPELEVALLHLQSPGWADSLSSFARSGGFAGCAEPLPPQPISVLWGEQDRILGTGLRREAKALFAERFVALPDCGHLPHLDQPKLVRDHWCNLTEPAPVPPSSSAPLQPYGSAE